MNGSSRGPQSRGGQDDRYLNPAGGVMANSNDRSYPSDMDSQSGPNGKVILEGYRQDILNGFEQDKPRYNPVRKPYFGRWWN